MANRSFCSAVLLFFFGSASADSLLVRVLDASQQPVPDVAIFVTQQGAARALRTPEAAVMDQRDKRFEPHILLVQKNAIVEFPNSDVVAHHVYSFSKPNDFALPLYKGTPPEPVRFEHDGVVTLGCNIHDGMLGYIVVVDTDLFAMTSENGEARLEVDSDAQELQVYAWSPRIRDSREPLVTTVRQGEELSATFSLRKKLRPSHVDQSDSALWHGYD